MAELTTNSPLARKIVSSFLDFLTSVKPSPGVDVEGLEVARDCLAQVFDIDMTSTEEDIISPYPLVNFFRSVEAADEKLFPSFVYGSPVLRAIKDELLVKFLTALDGVHLLSACNDDEDNDNEDNNDENNDDDDDDTPQLETAARIFYQAFREAESSGCQNFDLKAIGVTLKSLGNNAMKSKSYTIAVDMYSCAIACENNNAVYYCNRAAAYTQMCMYEEAIQDCEKSIELNSSYSKAYSRLGTAYYAQGNFRDALYKGFSPALELEPQNVAIMENILSTQRKMMQLAQQRDAQQLNSQGQSSSTAGGGSSGNGSASTIGDRPAGVGPTQADFGEMLRNMAGGVHPMSGAGVGGDVGGGMLAREGVEGAVRHMFTLSLSQGGPVQPGSGGGDGHQRPAAG